MALNQRDAVCPPEASVPEGEIFNEFFKNPHWLKKPECESELSLEALLAYQTMNELMRPYILTICTNCKKIFRTIRKNDFLRSNILLILVGSVGKSSGSDSSSGSAPTPAPELESELEPKFIKAGAWSRSWSRKIWRPEPGVGAGAKKFQKSSDSSSDSGSDHLIEGKEARVI